MKIKKAVIPAAGLGTRVLPASKSMPKEMLPIVDKPAIQYIVEEAVKSRHRGHPDHHQPRQNDRWRTTSTATPELEASAAGQQKAGGL